MKDELTRLPIVEITVLTEPNAVCEDGWRELFRREWGGFATGCDTGSAILSQTDFDNIFAGKRGGTQYYKPECEEWTEP